MQKTRSPLRDRLEYIAFRMLAGLVRAMPVEFASRLSGRLWRLFAPMLSRHKRAVAAIAQSFPEHDPAWHRQKALEMWDNLGRVFAEGFHLDEICASGRVELENPHDVKKLLGDPARLCVAAIHAGNWEVGADVLPGLGARACGIYQRIHNPLVDAYIQKLRSPLYPAGLFPKQGRAARQVMAQVKAGGSLVTMGDLRDWSGPKIPFFGRLAPSNTFPALIARQFDIPLFAVIVARAPRNGDSVRFRVKWIPVDVPRTSDREADILAATTALQAQFETFIREYPGQWMWAHKRWGLISEASSAIFPRPRD